MRLYYLLFCLLLGQVAAAEAQDNLTLLSQTINEKLYGLRTELRSLQIDLTSTTQQLQTASADLSLSEQEREMLQQQLTMSSNSLRNMTEKYSSLSTDLMRYKARLDVAVNLVIVLSVILVIRLILMITGYILYAKGVKLPRWLDILL